MQNTSVSSSSGANCLRREVNSGRKRRQRDEVELERGKPHLVEPSIRRSVVGGQAQLTERYVLDCRGSVSCMFGSTST